MTKIRASKLLNQTKKYLKKYDRRLSKLPLYLKLPAAAVLMLAIVVLGLQYRHHQFHHRP